MKIHSNFKRTLMITFAALYLSGLVVWVLQTWFMADHGFGLEKPAQTVWFLRGHSIVGLWFLIVFGYLFRSHIQPALRSRASRPSGYFLLALFAILILTVPGLFYLVNEGLRNSTAAVHTYCGVFILLPFVFHSVAKKFLK